jgi:hypothetical protein
MQRAGLKKIKERYTEIIEKEKEKELKIEA